jgi:hypothetical protein
VHILHLLHQHRQMTKEEIYNKLQNYKSIDRIQLVRADYKGTNEGFNEQLTNVINELQSDYDMKYYKRLNDLCMILDKAENENDLDRIKNIKSQIESHEKTIDNLFLISLKKEIENYIKQIEPQQTVFDLTIENLLRNGCNEQEANKLFNTTGSCTYRWNIGNFYVSKLENKFYTGIDFHRKVNFNNGSLLFPVNCPDLIPEYYNLALYEFLQKQKKSLGLLYNEVNQTEKFISNEIKRSVDIIDNAKESFLKRTQHKFESKELLVNVYESYIYFLDQHQQVKMNNTDEVLLKNEDITIFKNDIGFTLFIKMFELYKDEKTELANFSFLFFAMEKDFLVCSQADFVKFLENEKYNISIEKIDNRQFKWQINKKSKLYNSIKETLQKKHE